jgi:GT2 family glycosyltransferase/glycosyltransferase involved in cell wall biosynthesis
MLPIEPSTRERLAFAGPRLAEYEARRHQAAALAGQGDWEGALRSASDAAIQAYTFLGGLFSDPGLDELLGDIGEQVLQRVPPSLPEDRPRRAACDLLHLVSYTGFVGGHTELLRLWLRTVRGLDRRQALFSTEIIATVELERWAELIELADQSYFSNSALTFVQRIEQLARFIDLVHPKLISLFVHPHDVVTVATLGGLRRRAPRGPRVVVVNHADHAFWLGASLADHVVDFRSVGEIYTRRYRGVSQTSVVPLTCSVAGRDRDRLAHRTQLRQELGISGEATVSLSVASLYKILGSRWDFIDSIIGLLRAQPDHHHLLILGQGDELVSRRVREAGLSDRFHVWGKRADLIPYYLGSDFLIETFPLMGGNVRQEAMVLGCPMIVVNPPGFEQNTAFLGLPEGYPIVSHQVELEALASAFLSQPAERERLGDGLARYAQEHFSYERVQATIGRLVQDMLTDRRPNATAAVDPGTTFPFDRMFQQYALSKAEQEFLAGSPERGLAELAYAAGPDEPTPAMNGILRRHVLGVRQPAYGQEEDRLLLGPLVAWARGDLARAMEEGRSLVTKRPGLTLAWRFLAECAIDANKKELAIEALTRAVTIDPQDSRSHSLLAQIYLGAGDLARAHALVQRILAHNEHHVEGLLILSQLCEHANKPDLAETFLRSAFQIEPYHPRRAGMAAWFSPGEKTPVSVVITAHHGLPFTHRCLESIRFQGDRRVEEIIVVDDGSTDGTFEYLEARARRWDLLRPIRLERNLGFASAANQGVAASSRPYVLLIDNDAELRPNTIAALAELLDRDESVAVAQAKLLYPHGTVEHAGYAFPRKSVPGASVEVHPLRRHWNPADPTLNERLRMRALSMSMALVRRSSFLAQDGFDSEFINGMEDVDLSLRLGLAGHRLVFEPAAVGIHHGGASGWARWRARQENNRRFWNRWRSELEADFLIESDGKLRRAATSMIEPYTVPMLVPALA